MSKRLNKDDAWLVQFITLCHADRPGIGGEVGEPRGPVPQSVIADFLRARGYVSTTGRPLSASHISNFEKDHLGLSRTIEYKKDNYPMNHVIVKRLMDADCFDLKTKIENDEDLTDEDYEKAERGGAAVCIILLKLREYYYLNSRN